MNIDNGLLYECERKSNGRVVHDLANWIQQYKGAAELLSMRKLPKCRVSDITRIFETAADALRKFTVTGQISKCQVV